MMKKTLSVSAIENGTVIDHIGAGQGIRIIHLLGLLNTKHQVTIGLNLPSQQLGFKDIIKIENYFLTKEKANEVTVFAPEATINMIKDFEVVDKVVTSLPPSITDAFICPNAVCITRIEPVVTLFNLTVQGKQVNLVCKYCEKSYDRNQVQVKI